MYRFYVSCNLHAFLKDVCALARHITTKVGNKSLFHGGGIPVNMPRFRHEPTPPITKITCLLG